MSIRRKSLIVARLLIAVPIAFSLMGSTGKSTVFSCGGEMLEVVGPCDVDGGVNCSTDGGSPVKGGPISDDPPNGTNARLELTVLPASTVAPGHGRMLRASVIGTAAQVKVVQEMFWVLSKHAGTVLSPRCPDGMTGSSESCLGRLDLNGQSSSRPISDNPSFFVPYEAFADPDAANCEDQPSKGLSVDVTAFTKGVDGLVSLAASATIRIDCPDFSVSPGELTMGPGGQTQQFSAVHADGNPASVFWSVQTLNGSPSSTGGTIDPFGLYRTPQSLPSSLSVVMVTATSIFDLSVAEAAFVYLQPKPVEVVITSTTTVFTPSSTPSFPFHAEVRNLNYLVHAGGLRWSINKGNASGPVPDPAKIELDEESGVLSFHSPLSLGEEGAYVVTATSVADQTKSDHLTIYIYNSPPPPATIEIDDDAPATLVAGESYTFTALVEGDLAGDTTVEWTATCTSPSPCTGTSSINASTGVFTARPIGGSSDETWKIRATHGSGGSAIFDEKSVVVDGPVVVTIAQEDRTVSPGDTVGPFSALVEKVATNTSGVTWTSSVTSSSAATFDPVTKVLRISTTSGMTSYTVTATSVTDPRKSDSVIITVGTDPTGLTGTISYNGTKTGTVYVECKDSSGALKSGTAALVDFPSNSGTRSAPFRIHGGACSSGSTVTAWMDTLGVGRFVAGADPTGAATVPSIGPRTVTLTLTDYAAPTPPSGMTDPTIIEPVLRESGGAIVRYMPFVDGSGNEYAQEYLIYSTRQTTGTTTIDTTVAPLMVKPGTFGIAFVPIPSSGNYAFAIQAKFTSLGGTTTMYPSTPVASSEYPFPVTSGASILGGTNVSALPVSSAGGVLHALAYNSSNALKNAGRGLMSASNAYADFKVVDLASGNYGLRFVGDLNGNGQIDPTDLLGYFFAPLKFLESGLTISDGLPATISGTTDYVLPSTYVFANTSATAHAFADVSITTTTERKITYVVQAGLKPVVQVTRLSGPAWGTEANRDLYCADHRAPSQDLRRNVFVGTTSLDSLSPPTTVTAKLRVKYANGSSEELEAKVADLLKDPAVEIVADTTYPTKKPVTPVFNWSSVVTSPNAIDHYVLTLTPTGGGATTTITSISPSALTYAHSEPPLATGTEYSYTLTAIDVAGDRLSVTGSFQTVPE